ncbi:unnamed protein product [Rotaria sordida]|uniref:Uncharacterized protein n=1 Tax=Rotaria sordida TaxID=392033 RepID=A0A814U4Z9_9BILA|nr:unnamed protein product [Rotaria sordida]
MARLDTTMAELIIDADQLNRKDNKYLPYLNNNFNDSFDNSHQQTANQYPFTHIYDRDGRVFLPDVSVNIKSIVAEQTDRNSTEVSNRHWYFLVDQTIKRADRRSSL